MTTIASSGCVVCHSAWFHLGVRSLRRERISHTSPQTLRSYHGRDAARLPDVRTHDTTSRDTAVFDVTCRSSALAQASSNFQSLCGLGLSQPSSSTSRGQPCNSRSPVSPATSWALAATPRMTSVGLGPVLASRALCPPAAAAAAWRGQGRVPIAGWSYGGVGPDRGLRGGGRRGWCAEWAWRR